MATRLKHSLTFKGTDIVEVYFAEHKTCYAIFMQGFREAPVSAQRFLLVCFVFLFLHQIHVPSITPPLAC